MIKYIITLFASLLMAAIVEAAPGYCHECSCNRFDRDYYNDHGSEWYCKCGHSWNHHNFANRPSFAGNIFPMPEEDVGPTPEEDVSPTPNRKNGVQLVAGLGFAAVVIIVIGLFVISRRKIPGPNVLSVFIGLVCGAAAIYLLVTAHGIWKSTGIALAYLAQQLIRTGHP